MLGMHDHINLIVSILVTRAEIAETPWRQTDRGLSLKLLLVYRYRPAPKYVPPQPLSLSA